MVGSDIGGGMRSGEESKRGKGKEMANGGRKEEGEDEAGRIGGRLRHGHRRNRRPW